MKYLSLYRIEQSRRDEVKPGISSWAQVNGRNAISWEKKFEYDLYYVEHQSFSLDIKIFFLTILNILKRKGINATQHVPMTEFLGSNSTAP
jgi:lipopolysaccharide/colanic/teichoic acid biosynthesis glycosyltransferase